MHGSIYAQAVADASALATQLGHRLNAFWVKAGAARTECRTCGSAVAVFFHGERRAVGNAVDMPCEHGEVNVAPQPAPAPPTARALRLPTLARVVPLVAPTSPPATWDDVPFPTDAPRRDAIIIR